MTTEFTSLGLEHYPFIEQKLLEYPQISCELAAASLFAWKQSRSMSILSSEDWFVLISQKENGVSIFGPPVGNLNLEEAINRVQDRTNMPVIACERITEPHINSFKGKNSEIFEDRNNFDYVYKQSDLADLSGRKYHKKRNLISQCLSEFECFFEPLSLNLLPEIKEMQDRWCASKDCGKTPNLCHEYRAIISLLDHAKSLNLIGGAIRIEGKIQAYTIGSKLNKNTAAVHFEKAMPEYKGLYQLINQWFCKNELSTFEFINREQDLGREGLRQAKESYFPDHMIKKYVLLKNIGLAEYEGIKTAESRCT